MEENYLEVKTKCPKCGKDFTPGQSSKCPHKWIKQPPDAS